ncbi:MAG TPA: hypothetical protein VGM82_11690 [Gemmatimonadaceae bacterium]|jgi:hypothetical protein
MRVVVMVGLVATLFVGVAEGQKRPVSNGRIAGEIVAGTLGVPLGFGAGYTIGSGFRPHGSSNTGVALGFAGALAGPATAVNWVGNGGPSHGNFGATIGGTALGYGAAVLAFPLARKLPGKLKLVATVATAFLPAIGATAVYNWTRK